MSVKTHAELVEDYMNEFGSITSMEAFRDLGITRLADSIYRLRRREDNPLTIVSKDETSVNRYGKTVHYARYSIATAD